MTATGERHRRCENRCYDNSDVAFLGLNGPHRASFATTYVYVHCTD